MSDSLQVSLELPSLEGVVGVRSFHVEEQLCAPYRAVVTVETDASELHAERLRGTDARLLLARPASERALAGLVRVVQEGRLEGGLHVCELVVEPALAHLGLTRRTRIFQERDAPSILEEVLRGALAVYGREVRLELEGSYAPREQCVQYQESDRAFAERLMEEEGIAYTFDHSGSREVMVLTDRNASFAQVEGAEEPLELGPVGVAVGEREPLYRFTRAHGTTTTSVVVRDFDWTNPKLAIHVRGESRSTDARGRDRERYEHGWGRSATIYGYEEGARRYQEEDTVHRATIRTEAHLARALVGRGLGRVVGLRPGTTFELAGHPAVGVDGEYLVTRVAHESRSAESALGVTGVDDVEAYHNRFECIPLDVPFRPARRAQKPRIPSVQTALVTGPAGEEIHTDEHGRIKVRFPWDRDSPADETSSCWVRVQQKWAGAGWGFFWLPRVGMEVVVQFVDGDPDRPLVTGAVYDGAHGTPYPLPDEKTRSTIKSNSSPGGGGYNELRFEDAAGREQVFTHAQRDYDEVVENDHHTRVRRHQRVEVDRDQRQTVHGSQRERVDGDQTLGVGADRAVHVEGDYEETVDGTETRTVRGDVVETFAGNERRSVGVDLAETIGGGETRTQAGGHSEAVTGSVTRDVGGASTVTVGGASERTVAGGIEVSTPAAWAIAATAGLNITAPAGVRIGAPGGLRVGAPGGVTQVDGASNIIASLVKKDGGSIRNLISVKNEYVGIHVSAVGVAITAGVLQVQVGVKVETKTAADLKAGINAGAQGVRASAGPTSKS